jgi:hypothetical protein
MINKGGRGNLWAEAKEKPNLTPEKSNNNMNNKRDKSHLAVAANKKLNGDKNNIEDEIKKPAEADNKCSYNRV